MKLRGAMARWRSREMNAIEIELNRCEFRSVTLNIKTPYLKDMPSFSAPHFITGIKHKLETKYGRLLILGARQKEKLSLRLYALSLPYTSNPEIFHRLGKHAENQGNFEKAELIYRQGLDRSTEALRFYQALAQLAVKRNNWPNAIAIANSALAIDPRLPIVSQLLARAYIQSQQWEEAARAYQDAIKSEPHLAWMHHNLGLVRLKQARWREASDAFRTALRQSERASDTRTQSQSQSQPPTPTHVKLCLALAHQQDWQTCSKLLVQVVRDRHELFAETGTWLPDFLKLDLEKTWTIETKLHRQNPEDHKIRREFLTVIDAFHESSRYIEPTNLSVDLKLVADLLLIYLIEKYPDFNWYTYVQFHRALMRLEKRGQLNTLSETFQQEVQRNSAVLTACSNLAAIANFKNDDLAAAKVYATLVDRRSDRAVDFSADGLNEMNLALETRLKPSFFIVGTQKGGTSSLYKYLRLHPQICGAARKEIHYWSLEYHRNPIWYYSHFPRGDRDARTVTGEASVTYFDCPEVPARLHAAIPEAKIIVMLRNPADRAVSHYHHMYSKRSLSSPVGEFLRQELEFTQANPPETIAFPDYEKQIRNRVISRGLYLTFMQRWLALFPRSSFCVIDSSEFFRRTPETLERVQRFIGVEPVPLDEYPAENVGSYRKIPDSLREEMRDFFRPYNSELMSLLDVEFDW